MSQVVNILKSFKQAYTRLGTKSLTFFGLWGTVTMNVTQANARIAWDILNDAQVKAEFLIHKSCFHPEPYLYYHCKYLTPAEYEIVLDTAIALAEDYDNKNSTMDV